MPPKKKTETSAAVRMHVLGEEVFTTDQIAHDLNISVRTVLRAIHSGKLKARRTGKQYLMTRTAIRAWWEAMPLARQGEAAEKSTHKL